MTRKTGYGPLARSYTRHCERGAAEEAAVGPPASMWLHLSAARFGRIGTRDVALNWRRSAKAEKAAEPRVAANRAAAVRH